MLELARSPAAGLSLNNHIVSACVIVEIALIYAKKQHAVTLGHKIPSCSNKKEVVVIVADDRDQSACCLGAHQFLIVC